MKYFILYEKEGQNIVEHFNILPKGVYYAAGYQDPSDKGKAYITKLTDQGTSLIPVMVTKTGKQYKRK